MIISTIILNCSGPVEKLKIFSETNNPVILDSSKIYLFSGYKNSCPVFRNTDDEEYIMYSNDSFFRLKKIVDGNLIYVNDLFAVFTEKDGNSIKVKIKHAYFNQKNITVKDRIFFNLDQGCDKFVYQEAYNSTIKFLDFNNDSIAKPLGIKGFCPILRENSLYFTKATQANTNGLSDLFVRELNNPATERTILSKIYEEGLEISPDNKYIITIKYTESGDYYTIYNIYDNDYYYYKDEKLNNYYPVFLNKKEILFYNPRGLDYIIKKIPN